MKRHHLVEWGIFFVFLIGLLHYKIGLTELPLWAWEFLGLQSGRGPLVIEARENGEELIITIQNDGRASASIAVIEGRDHRSKSVFKAPIPANTRFSKNRPERDLVTNFKSHKVPAKSNLLIGLDLDELRSLHCKILTIVDGNAASW